MRRIAIIAALAVVSSAAAATEPERYHLEKSPDGFVRMDTQTGEMSICSERDGQLVCKLAADERSAFQADVDRLQASLDKMEKRVTALENSLTARAERSLPTQEEIDKGFGYMEQFLRRFMGVVKEMDERPPSAEMMPGDNKT